MRKIKDAKKLQLNMEVIQTLTPNELEDVVGGTGEAGEANNQNKSSAVVVCTKIPTCCNKGGGGTGGLTIWTAI